MHSLLERKKQPQCHASYFQYRYGI